MNPVDLSQMFICVENPNNATIQTSGTQPISTPIISTPMIQPTIPTPWIGSSLFKMNILNWGSDIITELHENIDSNKLNFIVKNPDIFKPLLRDDKKLKELMGDCSDPLLMAERLLLKTRRGILKATYIQKRGVGRKFAVGQMSLQCTTRQIRQCIAADTYDDIDMINCHPNILRFICQQLKIPCPVLDRYCENRSQFFIDNKIDKATCKIAFLSIMNGGSQAFNALAAPSPELKMFYRSEIKEIHEKISAVYPKKFAAHVITLEQKNKDYNHVGSFMNIILCDIENKILDVMFDFFGKPDDAVLCFDGIMLKKGLKYDLPSCEAKIFSTLDIKMGLAIKPFEEAFDLSSYEVPIHDQFPLNVFSDFQHLTGREVDEEIVTEWMENTLTMIVNGGASFVMTKNKLVDHTTKEVSIFYTEVKEEILLKNIARNVSINNPSYSITMGNEYALLSTNKKLSYKKKLTPDKLKCLDKFIYTDLSNFIRDQIKANKIPHKNSIDFIPHLKSNPPASMDGIFNSFTGFPLDEIVLETKTNFEDSLMYFHIGEIICNGDLKEREHLLDCIADMLQEASVIKACGHMFYSKPGAGKGMLLKFMINIMGNQYVQSYVNTDAYFNNFNKNRSYKLLKVFEEVAARGSAFKNHDQLKGEMDSSRETIEPKGKDAYTVSHCARFWFFTNNESALYIEGGDRRFTLHKVSDSKIGDKDYFERLHAEIMDMQLCKTAFDWLCNRKYEARSVRTCIETTYKIDQKVTCMGTGIRFLMEMIECSFPGIRLYNDACPIKILQEKYKIWCSDNGCAFNTKTLQTQIRQLIDDEKEPRSRLYVSNDGSKSKPRCYRFNRAEMCDHIRRYLKDPTFEFETAELTKDEKMAAQLGMNPVDMDNLESS